MVVVQLLMLSASCSSPVLPLSVYRLFEVIISSSDFFGTGS